MDFETIDAIQNEIISIVDTVFPDSNQIFALSNNSTEVLYPYSHIIFEDLHFYYSAGDKVIGKKNCDIGFTVLNSFDRASSFGGTTGFTTPIQAINNMAKRLTQAIFASTVLKDNTLWSEIQDVTYEVKTEPAVNYNISGFSYLITTQVINGA